MAGGGTEIARAFVTIIPKSDGKFGSEIDKSLGQLGKTGDEQGTKAGKAFAEKFGAFGGKAGALAGKALAVGLGAATAGVIGFAKSSVEAGRNFDASMSQVAATMGKSVDEIQDLRAFAQEMGAKTAFSASEDTRRLRCANIDEHVAERAQPRGCWRHGSRHCIRHGNRHAERARPVAR